MKRVYYFCVVATGFIYSSDKLQNPTIQVITGEFTAVTVPALAVPSPSATPSQPLIRKEPKALTARSVTDKGKSDKKTAHAANPKRATCPPTFTAPKTTLCFTCTDHGWQGPTKCPLCEGDHTKQPSSTAPAATLPVPQSSTTSLSVLALPAQDQEGEGIHDGDIEIDF